MRIGHIYINGTTIKLTDLVIIVGPNGSGKTTFLKDLHSSFLVARPNGVAEIDSIKWSGVVRQDSLKTSIKEWDFWVNSLIEVPGASLASSSGPGFAIPNYLARQQKGNYIGRDIMSGVKEWLLREDVTDQQKVEGLGNGPASQPFRDQQSIYMSVDDRFYVSANSSGAVSYEQMSSMNVVSFLVKHPEVLRRIDSSVASMFKKSIRVETPSYPNYNIISVPRFAPSMPRLSQTTRGFLEQPKIYKEWLLRNSATLLRDEGHGVRAAIEILYGLELSSNKIVFLDEPELHLYPSTKYSLGQIIARYTKGQSRRQVILVTHDTDMLSGLLHIARDATIIRINKDRSITTSSSNGIRQTSQTEFLRGAFLDAAILVEGIDDAYVYGRVFQQKKILQEYSYNFVPCHGKDRMTDNLTVYQNLNIPFAIIVDFDALYSDKRNGLIESYLVALKINNALSNTIQTQLKSVRNIISGKTNKKRGIRMGGLTNLEKTQIQQLLVKLANVGIFVIPVGELEDWVNATKADKEPDEIVNMYTSASNTKYAMLTKFVRDVGGYIRNKIES